MKGLCYFRIHDDNPANTGIVQKSRAIADAFRNQGYSMDTVFFRQEGILIGSRLIRFSARKHSFGHVLLYYQVADSFLWKHLKERSYDFIWIRHLPTHPSFLKLLRRIKNRHPETKILLEMPTWPYDREYTTLVGKIMLAIDRLNRKRLYRFVDHCIHYGAETIIWRMPCINIRNGFVPLENKNTFLGVLEDDFDEFKLIFVGQMSSWHGLDRLLEGLAQYAQNAYPKKVVLEIVGTATEEFKIQVRQLNLEEIVRYHGPVTGRDLLVLLRASQIGIGTLAIYRKGLTLDSSLKHRLYAAAGLPFVLSGFDPDFNKNENLWHYIPADDTPVSISELLDWRERLGPVASRLVTYAWENLTWERQIQKIIQNL